MWRATYLRFLDKGPGVDEYCGALITSGNGWVAPTCLARGSAFRGSSGLYTNYLCQCKTWKLSNYFKKLRPHLKADPTGNIFSFSCFYRKCAGSTSSPVEVLNNFYWDWVVLLRGKSSLVWQLLCAGTLISMWWSCLIWNFTLTNYYHVFLNNII